MEVRTDYDAYSLGLFGRTHMPNVRPSLLVLLAALSVSRPSRAEEYRSATVDSRGQLHILLDSGKEIQPPKTRTQVAFDSARIAADHRTVGWLVMYEKSPSNQTYPLALELTLYRNRRVLHTFAAGQTFWDWQFWDRDKRVAYCTGPVHGGAAECVLRDVETGRVVERWRVKEESEPPDWARALHK